MILDPRGGYNRKAVDKDFFKDWTPEMSYTLGFLFADGALLDTNGSSRTYYLNFTNNDLDLLLQIRSAMQSEHRIYERTNRLITWKEKEYKAKTGYVLRIGSKEMYNDLIGLGLQHRKSNIMHLPDIPDQFFPFFLRGYFDGDGCINTYLPKHQSSVVLSVIFTSGSELFLSQLAKKLHLLLNIATPHYYKRDGGYNLISKGWVALLIMNYIYRDLELAPYLKRKYLRYVNYMHNQIGSRVRAKLATYQLLSQRVCW